MAVKSVMTAIPRLRRVFMAPPNVRSVQLIVRSKLVKPLAGNGVADGIFGEACDDGNTNNNDGCTNGCAIAECGDGIVRTGSETCDDGNTTSGDGCSSFCQIETNSGDGGAGGAGGTGGAAGSGGDDAMGGAAGDDGAAVAGGQSMNAKILLIVMATACRQLMIAMMKMMPLVLRQRTPIVMERASKVLPITVLAALLAPVAMAQWMRVSNVMTAARRQRVQPVSIRQQLCERLGNE